MDGKQWERAVRGVSYQELVKNFGRIRDYMREFYIYGFKSREEFTGKSARSYDDERRRLESWLGDYMRFRQTPDGKQVFLSIDSRLTRHNPLFQAWKTKSFTDGDITLHFLILDLLSDPGVCMSVGEIMERIDAYLAQFPDPRVFDESTVRKKLNEYVSLGILISEKRGRALYYRRAGQTPLPDREVLDYFSEVLPCGVIGSYLLDKNLPDETDPGERDSHFAFKHHYITSTMDSEILCLIFLAMREKRSMTLKTVNRHRDRVAENRVIPIKIMISVQSGRQYLMGYLPRVKRITAFRTDNIISVKLNEESARFEEMQSTFQKMLPHIWGVSTQGRTGARMEHVEFTVRYSEDEKHIRNRLEREKRCGVVEHLDEHTSRFSADVFDASEVIPWIRTFICRITEIHFSNRELEAQFQRDLQEMYALYGIGEDTEADLTEGDRLKRDNFGVETLRENRKNLLGEKMRKGENDF